MTLNSERPSFGMHFYHDFLMAFFHCPFFLGFEHYSFVRKRCVTFCNDSHTLFTVLDTTIEKNGPPILRNGALLLSQEESNNEELLFEKIFSVEGRMKKTAMRKIKVNDNKK
ncbi:hypothetical protein AVEN_82870-1 [Araneus ventricosus]|uniref:Uncharacterized protein n=1 Tax=Araneus ventricosus TaxID=182803 RepID=A0A4Y2PYL6_ARAVE|nr:hypothetical protein AVEN_82870-1 [Araneus ventricosus]